MLTIISIIFLPENIFLDCKTNQQKARHQLIISNIAQYFITLFDKVHASNHVVGS